MNRESWEIRPQISKLYLPIWVTILICVFVAGLTFNTESDILIPVLIGVVGAQTMRPVSLKRSKYKLIDGKLYLPSGFRSKPYELVLLQSVQIKNNNYLIQIFTAKPPQTLQLQFKSAIPRHGKVELWTSDQEIIVELNKYAHFKPTDP